jgi:hypothetical protein
VKVLLFFENYFYSAREFATLAEARAFSAGVSEGAGQYGCGAVGAYVIPGDEDEMLEFERPEEIHRASVATPRKHTT